jgi:UDP-glucose 4-epimerase
MNVLVTGGAGFIGSHTVVELFQAGHSAVILDDFSNSEPFVLDRIAQILGYSVKCYEGNFGDKILLTQIFEKENIEGVIHFAASKAVGESVANPLKYYRNNVAYTVTLLESILEHGIQNLVFSSSCTVYGEPDILPVTEDTPTKPATSPYGNSKQICESIIKDTVASGVALKAMSLRYFNPMGAHESALIGELPRGVPSNLIPFVTQTAAGMREKLTIFGGNYPTPDGTCIRDYIHVVDLAKAHVKAIEVLNKQANTQYYDFFNIGTGNGNSVLEVIHTFEEVNNLKLNYEIKDRRAGDVVQVYADVSKSADVLGWQTEKTLADALKDAWRWQQQLT